MAMTIYSTADQCQVSFNLAVEEFENHSDCNLSDYTGATANLKPSLNNKTLVQFRIIIKIQSEVLSTDGDTILEDEVEVRNELICQTFEHSGFLNFFEAQMLVFKQVLEQIYLPLYIHRELSSKIGLAWEDGDRQRSCWEGEKLPTLVIESELCLLLKETVTRLHGQSGSSVGIPASKSSIEALETAEIIRRREDDDDGPCVICLEDYSVGVEVSRMPCSHNFHKGCIVRWLQQSHFCPVCRYQMPTV